MAHRGGSHSEFLVRFGAAGAVAVFLAAVLLAAFPQEGRADEPLRAGAARVSITPNPKATPYPLGGYVSPERISQSASGVHDTCYARALVLAAGATRCAIVSLDLCFLPDSLSTAVAERIRNTAIPPEALFLSATHTHSGLDPLILHDRNNGTAGALPKYDAAMLSWMADRVAEAVIEADRNLKPATLGGGRAGPLGLNRNRRGESLTDDELVALKVTDRAGRPLAAICCYAAHPVYYGPSMLQVSGDWPGAYARTLEGTMPGVVALFLNGAEGDASPSGSDTGTPAEKIEIYAAKLAECTRALLRGIRSRPSVVRAWQERTPLVAPVPNPLFLLAALRLRATQDEARALVDRLMPRECVVSFVQAGDLLLVGVPGEPTAAVGLAIKRIARERGFKLPAVVALTNGWLGYLLTADQYRAGKYEATMSFYGAQSGDLILAGVRKGLERLPGAAGRRKPH